MNFFTGTKSPRKSRGFTLSEILVAAALSAIVVAGAGFVFINSLNIYHYDTGKLLVNKDIRKFTMEMTENATYANYFKIFPSYMNLSRSAETLVNPNDPDSGYTTALTDTSVNDGFSGDCLVLVFKNPANDRKILRIIGYFRAPEDPDDPNSTGPVRRFDRTIPDASSLLPVWQLIPTITNASDYPVVLELSRGLADGKLFYNFRDHSIIIKGEILHQGNLTRRATNTYNFTVSPRG